MTNHTFKILAINPGSTSTKVALFTNSVKEKQQDLEHSQEEMGKYGRVWEQMALRRRAVEQFLEEHLPDRTSLDGVAGRGGLFRSIPGGVYEVNAAMLSDAETGVQGEHASNLGCALANAIAREHGATAYIVDPVSTDELESIARFSGHPSIERRSLSHALNLHHVARKVAEQLEVPLEESRFVIAHIGGGISVAPLRGGKIIDVNDANNEGPFSTTRSGTLPPLTLARWILDKEFDFPSVKVELLKKSGLQGYLGAADGKTIEKRIRDGDDRAMEILEAMAYQIGKEIAAMSSVLKGEIHRIILTGGLANFRRLVDLVTNRIDWIASVEILSGEYEMEALAEGVWRVLAGREQPRKYPSGDFL